MVLAGTDDEEVRPLEDETVPEARSGTVRALEFRDLLQRGLMALDEDEGIALLFWGQHPHLRRLEAVNGGVLAYGYRIQMTKGHARWYA
ncbi:hypothetical protein EBO15_33565 [Actinomadura harenae]|uniref:Uncharacterized protein n=1 Tax=Actinomadura harenae TaxID=2483351 RepID=A0A3M2LNT0_9ACTN|nr:hypothetical protein EBO15_33565 [Actinomadura harenae]